MAAVVMVVVVRSYCALVGREGGVDLTSAKGLC